MLFHLRNCKVMYGTRLSQTLKIPSEISIVYVNKSYIESQFEGLGFKEV